MCQHVEELKDLRYLDGSLIYLQRSDVNTNFPARFRTANFCLYCDRAITVHPPSFQEDEQCTGYKNAHQSKHFESHLGGSTYRFNLVTDREFGTFSPGNLNHPERSMLAFCPYCGEKQAT